MQSELHSRVKKTGQSPGTPIYTGNAKNIEPHITAVFYDEHDFHKTTGSSLAECLSQKTEKGMLWLHVEGLNNSLLVGEITQRFNLHPLTVEDILNIAQRPKIEEFDNYIFTSLKMLIWNSKTTSFSTEQISLVIGKNFVLSFLDSKVAIFGNIYERLQADSKQRLREKGSDYLAYRLIDTVVDQYFVVLENIGDKIEKLEQRIISEPTRGNAQSLYRLKHKLLVLRKAVWPMREVISHLLQIDSAFITPFTHLYVRDLYDHVVQAIDTVETFRDMLASILDIYLSSLSNRMNEIMKMLTIIATIFIPTTFIASVFGMNFHYMPGLDWHWGYPATLGGMLIITMVMLVYFWRKKWL